VSKPFASSADIAPKTEKLEIVAPGVYALTAEGDPNVGAIEGKDLFVCIEARATPAAARDWLQQLRQHTDKPVRQLVLTHYHAVRVLGASAFQADEIISSDMTKTLIEERGKEDWDSEFGRMPRLFKEPEEIPGLTMPTRTFSERHDIDLGDGFGMLELRFCGRGHTAGDIVVWHEKSKTLFAGDLVEAQAALYTGDAFHMEWASGTLDRIKAFGAENLIGGRGAVARGSTAVDAAIEQTREFLNGMIENVGNAHRNLLALRCSAPLG
jgi:glyoxylase-like metal-dependent hydrolase (beta-lactamase superfamily II)